MKISNRTLEILKNFSTINPSLTIYPGNTIRVTTPSMSVLADAVVEENFPETVRIYNMSKFLSIISLFDDPDVEFTDKYLDITDGTRNTRYFYAEAGMIIEPRQDPINVDDASVRVEASWEDINSVIKAASVLKFPYIALVGKEGKVSLTALNPEERDRATDTFGVMLGDTEDEFTQVISLEALKLTKGDYLIRLDPKGIASFKNDDIEYIVPIQKKYSRYERG